MKTSGKQRFCSRSVSLFLAAVMVLLCFGVCPVWAEGSVAAAMYTASYDPNMQFISQWDGALVQSSEYNSTTNKDTNTMPNGQTAAWGDWGGITESYDHQQQVEHFGFTENGTGSTAKTVSLSLNPGLTKGNATKLVVGARASRDLELYTYYNSTGQSDNEARHVNFVVNKSDDFSEYVITGINWGSLTTDIKNFRIAWVEGQGNNTLDFAYIRLVDDSCKGLVAGTKNEDYRVENGATDYDESDQIVDFAFPEDLKLDTVTADNIKINGSPVRRVTTTVTTDGNTNASSRTTVENKRNIRVDLGTLLKGTEYTVSFPGVETESGKSVDSITFTTAVPQPKQITPTMYKADTTGIVSSWEGSLVQSSDSISTSNTDINTLPDGQTAKWSNWGYVGQTYNEQQQVEHITIEDGNTGSASRTLTLVMEPVLNTDGATKLVIGARASREINLKMYYKATGQGDSESRNCQFTIDKSDDFREYVISGDALIGWDLMTDFRVARMDFARSGDSDNTIDFAYIRLVDDTYGTGTQSPIISGAEDYNNADSIVDFDFGEALNENTVSSSGITINGAPVQWAMILPENPNRIRVNLGKLRKGTEYTVSFSGLQTEDGYAVTDSDFTFTTIMPQLVDGSVTLHKAVQPTGVVGGWEGTSVVSTDYQPDEGNGYDTNALPNGQTAKWSDWGFAVESYSAEMQAERVTLWPNQNPTITLSISPAIEKGNAAKLVIGARAASDIPISLYAGVSGGNLYSGTPYGFTIDKSDDIREYVIDAATVWSTNWPTKTSFGYLRMDTQNSSSDTTYMDIAYIRLVNDDYTGSLSGDAGTDITPNEFSDTYDAAANSVFDLVFDQDLDLSTVTKEAVTFNGKHADWVIKDSSNKRRVRVCLGALTPLTRGRLTISGVENSEGEQLRDMEFRFTTAAADAQTGEHPVISTFELVENYAQSNETAVTADTDLSGKTVTAVAGGLYNNTEGENSYMLMLARYDEDGVLEAIDMNTYTLCGYESLSETGRSSASGGTGAKPTKVEMTVPSDGKHTVKAYAWNMSSLMPLSAALTRTAGN